MATRPICLIPGCGKTHEAKGYCRAHYMRLIKHGDPLGGSTSPGEPMRFIHEVALLHVGGDCLIWPFGKNKDGYGQLWIDGKLAVASRYVCELVNGPPPTPEHESAHSCGRGHEACIAHGHLIWKTHIENEADKLIHGTHSRGERSGQAKITEAQAREILAMKGIETQRNLAERFGVSKTAVGSIHQGLNWAWLSNSSKSLNSSTFQQRG